MVPSPVVHIFREGPRSSPVSEVIASQSSGGMSSVSKDKGLISSDGSTQKSGSPVKKEELAKEMNELMLAEGTCETAGETAG